MKKLFAVLTVLISVGISYPPSSNAGPVTESTITVTWSVPTLNCDDTPLTDYAYAEACISTDETQVDNNCVQSTPPHIFTNLISDTVYYINVNALDTSGNNSKTCKLTAVADLTVRTLKDTMPPAHSGCALAIQ